MTLRPSPNAREIITPGFILRMHRPRWTSSALALTVVAETTYPSATVQAGTHWCAMVFTAIVATEVTWMALAHTRNWLGKYVIVIKLAGD